MNKKYNRLISALMALTIVSSVCMIPVNAEDIMLPEIPVSDENVDESVSFEVDGLTYTIINENSVCLSKSTASAREISIPETVVYNDVEYTVTEIGERAFERKGVNIVILPPTITKIGNLAFYYSSLSEINIPDSVESIGEGAFSYCDKLTSFVIGNGVKSIGDKAFGMCNNLKTVFIPESIESIGNDIFYLCSLLKTIVYGSSEENWNTIFAENTLSENVVVVYDYKEIKTYNTSELTLGQKLNAGDTLHFNDNNGGNVVNIITEDGSYYLAYLAEGDYTLQKNAELVGIDFSTIFLAPEHEGINYIDARTLEAGDIIDRNSYLLCYDYTTDNRVVHVFFPSTYDRYYGEGTIKVKSIDETEKKISLEVVAETPVVSGDVNGDSKFNVADIVLIQQALVNKDTELDTTIADMNGDGSFNVFDMIIVKRMVLNS